MILTDLNRQGGIGANSLYVELGSFRFLIDAGLHPKVAGKEAMPVYDGTENKNLDFIILTHCHLDHIGSLPLLIQHHPDVSILMSLPSQIIAPVMLHNSCSVMRKQRDELNIPEYPLYSHDDVDNLREKILPVTYGSSYSFNHNNDLLEICFYSSGHVAGAAGFSIKHENRKIFFTGDVHFTEQQTILSADFPHETFDTVVMETTRGMTERSIDKSRKMEENRLIEIIDETLSHGGSCLVPVFAFGRMQEILTMIYHARKEGDLRESPIFCGGLGVKLAHALDQISRDSEHIKFSLEIFKELKIKSLPKKIFSRGRRIESGLYIVSSGMMVANTPSYLIAASLLSKHRNTICFVGYCDPDTPGGKLLNTPAGDNFLFEFLDYSSPVNARIEKLDLSSHADREDLLMFALNAKPRAVVLTHGETKSKKWFTEQIKNHDKKAKVIDPHPLESCIV